MTDAPTSEPAAGPAPFAGRVSGTAAAPDDVSLAWYRRGDAVEVEITSTASPDDPRVPPLHVALYRSLAVGLADAGASLHLAADHPAHALDPWPEALAEAVGLHHRRDLHVMGRPLPVPADHPLRATAPATATRPFDPATDAEAWLRANNRAFATHPDQGQETLETLGARQAEAWFDPADFLVADDAHRPGELAGFCWTKVHPATVESSARGEIYVIGVDPAHRGEGLGPSFVLAGLDHLAGRGLASALLYVDADNAPATRLYDRLDFVVERRRRVYAPLPQDAS